MLGWLRFSFGLGGVDCLFMYDIPRGYRKANQNRLDMVGGLSPFRCWRLGCFPSFRGWFVRPSPVVLMLSFER